MNRYTAFGLAVLASLILCACGGGGSSSSTPGFVKVIGVPGVTTGTNFSFDISAVDPVKERMYYTNRNNASVDVIDVTTNTFLKRITGGFAGCNTGPTCVGANNDMSGPDGLNLITGTPFIYVGDVNSVKIIDTSSDTVVHTIAIGATSGLRGDDGC